MNIQIDVPEYSHKDGVILEMEDNSYINVEVRDNLITLKANKDGLVTLARLCFHLSLPTVSNGCHIHLASWNVLTEESNETIIVRT